MHLSRRQLVEGGLAVGFAALAAKPVLAASLDQPGALAVRRRPDLQGSVVQAQPAGGIHPHPGQPLPPQLSQAARPQPTQLAQRPRVPASPAVSVRSISPALVASARRSFDRHRRSLTRTDVVGIVDFSKRSNETRFYLLDTNTGVPTAHYVSHGRGSDPAHTGLLQRFSNQPGSLATSEGGYVTSEYYIGRYGQSMRVRGLDYTNSNAEARAIVIHPAWYAEPTHLATHGILGRSEGCFALGSASLRECLARLGPGHFLYAART
jgi:hypothetical protein